MRATQFGREKNGLPAQAWRQRGPGNDGFALDNFGPKRPRESYQIAPLRQRTRPKICNCAASSGFRVCVP